MCPSDEASWEWTDDEDLSLQHNYTQSYGDTASTVGSFTRNAPVSKNDEAESSRLAIVSHFIGMGFQEELVTRAVQEHDESDMGSILDSLLSYAAIEKSPLSETISSQSDGEISFSDMEGFSDKENDEDLMTFRKDEKLSQLLEMGFPEDDATVAIERCGPNASFLELADSIHAAQMADETDEDKAKDDFLIEVKKPDNARKDRDQSNSRSIGSLPIPMVGFGLPSDPDRVTRRQLPEIAVGPPYFYFENVALAPKGVWEEMSRNLYGIEPEFVDSKHFCAAARKRGYIHNLPIDRRTLLLPVPAATIQDALPMTRKWWPSWDKRTKLNCILSCSATARLTERIRSKIAGFDRDPSPEAQRYVLEECRRWNLVWVGLHKVAPLEPDEVEMLLGFPKNHTRGGGICRTDRFHTLGKSFQVDTVAYHLSVLKDLFPQGMRVLSLFSGIGGAEVALQRMGIRLNIVVSVEKSEACRNIVQAWWAQTEQTGTLIHIDDVKKLDEAKLVELIYQYGGFDLIVGGSPCNNLSGSNRVSRNGLEGEHSSLFFDYCRILHFVRNYNR